MKESEIRNALALLRASLSRLQTLKAWLELKEGERRRGSPPGPMQSPGLEEEVRNEYAHFAGMLWDVLLDLSPIGPEGADQAAAESLRHEVLALADEATKLKLGKGF
jgi:hypothetical protein